MNSLIFRASFLRWQVSGESQPARASGVHPQSPWKSRDSIPPRLHGLTDQCGRQAAACHPGSSARQIRSGRLHACFHTASATASRSSVPSGKAVQKYAILENRKAMGQGRIRPTLPLRMPVRAVQTCETHRQADCFSRIRCSRLRSSIGYLPFAKKRQRRRPESQLSRRASEPEMCPIEDSLPKDHLPGHPRPCRIPRRTRIP